MEQEDPAIAIIPIEDWKAIHAFTREHDIARGNTEWHCFDARGMGAINVWTVDESHRERMGQLRGTFMPDRLDGKHPGELIDEVIEGQLSPAALEIPGFVAGQEAVIIRFDSALNPLLRYDEDEILAAWSQEAAEQFFDKLYKHVTGKTLPN